MPARLRHWPHGDLVALFPQSLHHEFAYEGVVLDDEYSHRRLLESSILMPVCERPTLWSVPANPLAFIVRPAGRSSGSWDSTMREGPSGKPSVPHAVFG